VLVTGVTLLITLGEGGKSSRGIRNFHLRVSQVTKRRKIHLTAGFFIYFCFYTTQTEVQKIFINLKLPLLNSAAKELFLGRKILEGHLPSPPCSPSAPR